MLASVFVAQAADTIRNPDAAAAKAAPLVKRAHGSLPADAARRIPSNPRDVVLLHAGLQAGAAVLFATGRAPRFAAAALAASIVPATVVNHDFWAEPDPERKAEQQAHFVKNIGLLGGVLLASADLEGKPSLAWRGRQAFDRATAAVAGAWAAARTSGTPTTLDKLGDGFSTLADKTRDATSVAAERGSHLLSVAAERGSELASVAAERGSELASAAAERGSEFADVAAERIPELTHAAAERSAAAWDYAAEKAEKAAEKGVHARDVAAKRWF